MKYLSAEWTKLFSTRSVYWCLAATFAIALLFALIIGLVTVDGKQFASTGTSQTGMSTAVMVFLVLAALTATTEYRFGTIRSTFVAAPRRIAVFAAKTGLVVIIGVAIALISAFAAFFLTKILATRPLSPVVLDTAGQIRTVAGQAPLFAVAGIIAVAVGTLLRQSAGAIALLLVWSALLEQLVALIPKVGADISQWLPFTAGFAFTTNYQEINDAFGSPDTMGAAVATGGPTPVQGLAVFAATAVVLWLLAAFVLVKRDA